MKPVVVIGAGALGSALVAALEHSGVTVILSERVTPIADFGAVLADLDVMVREACTVPPAVLYAPPPLVERRSPQAQPVPRWLPRPREYRTRRAK